MSQQSSIASSRAKKLVLPLYDGQPLWSFAESCELLFVGVLFSLHMIHTDSMSYHHRQRGSHLHSHCLSLGSTLYARSNAPRPLEEGQPRPSSKGSAKASSQAASAGFLGQLALQAIPLYLSWALTAHLNCARHSCYDLVRFSPFAFC